MSLITPSFGLIFWMVLIFGTVFLILAKFGFPVITGAVQKRSDHIEESLRKAEEASRSLETLAAQGQEILDKARAEQGRMLREASDAGEKIVAQARARAQEEAGKILEGARAQIAAEREAAIREIRSQIAGISMEVAEKIVRRELESDESQLSLIDRMVDEASRTKLS